MAPLQMYELIDCKYILKYICFLKKCLKNCAQKYIKNALQEVTNSTRPICGYIYVQKFHLANISDWNLKPCCGFRSRG